MSMQRKAGEMDASRLMSQLIGTVEESLQMALLGVEENRPDVEEFLARATHWIESGYMFSKGDWDAEARQARSGLEFIASAVGYGQAGTAAADQLIATLTTYKAQCEAAAQAAQQTLTDLQARYDEAEQAVVGQLGAITDKSAGLEGLIARLERV